MQEIKTVVYKTVDGKLFDKKEEAEKHEELFKNLRAFKVNAQPDLTEGRHGPVFQGYLLVNAKSNQHLFAEDWCFKKYGNGVAFVMGTFGSNAIIKNWMVTNCKMEEVENDKIIGRIQENFVDKLW